MILEELKIRLQIPTEDTSNDAYLTLILEDAISFVQTACNNDFMVNGVLILPTAAKNVVAQYVAFELQGNTGIKSESIGGMSQTFDSANERNNVLISKLSAAGLRRIRFRPFGRC